CMKGRSWKSSKRNEGVLGLHVMSRRRLIRSFFIAALTFCVLTLIGSYWKTVDISHFGAESMQNFGLSNGRFVILRIGSMTIVTSPAWRLDVSPSSDTSATSTAGSWSKLNTESAHHILGCSYDSSESPLLGKVSGLTIPLLYPVIISSFLLLFFWSPNSKATGATGLLQPATETKSIRDGVCPICGGDIRGLQPNQKCPKCGTQIPKFGWKRADQ
ncbi:MAG TPA: hypothetical protein VHM90_17980, partial [Phycisphaerae bacterium]|nr:hypothetical protein [Phycisphaerae bacterium]